jgi:hypothetical protein
MIHFLPDASSDATPSVPLARWAGLDRAREAGSDTKRTAPEALSASIRTEFARLGLVFSL